MRWTLLLLFAVCWGCTNNTKIPSGIIPKPEMESILWDMVQTDRYAAIHIQTRKDSLNLNKKIITGLYDNVLSLHKISRQDFYTSYSFYLGRPDIMKVMFDSISTRAERNRTKVMESKYSDTTKKNALLKRSDSLRKKILPKPGSLLR